MPATTTATIRSSLEALIRGAAPYSKALGRNKFAISNRSAHVDSTAPASDSDREAVVNEVRRGEPTFFGVLTTTDFHGEVDVTIWHKLNQNRQSDSLSRRDSDCQSISDTIEDRSNYPSGVSMIRLQSQRVSEIERGGMPYYETLLTFDIWYTL